MGRPLDKNPIPRRVDIKDALRTLYRDGQIKDAQLKQMLRSGRLNNGEYFYITNDINTLEK